MEKCNEWADPSATLLFLFSISSFATFGMYAEMFQGDAALFIGMLMLVSFPVYMLGGYMFARNGDTYSANIWLIFGFIFGGLMGMGNMLLSAGNLLGTDMPVTMYAVPLIVVGIGSGVHVLYFVYGDSIPFLTWFLAHCWCITSGIEYIWPIRAVVLTNTALSLIVGIGTGYMMASELLVSIGRKPFPMGRPLMRQPHGCTGEEKQEGVQTGG